MARSLVVRHDETARTSWLFTSFLVLAGGLLAAGWILGGTEDIESVPAVEASLTP
jgi:hypothetical protein